MKKLTVLPKNFLEKINDAGMATILEKDFMSNRNLSLKDFDGKFNKVNDIKRTNKEVVKITCRTGIEFILGKNDKLLTDKGFVNGEELLKFGGIYAVALKTPFAHLSNKPFVLSFSDEMKAYRANYKVTFGDKSNLELAYYLGLAWANVSFQKRRHDGSDAGTIVRIEPSASNKLREELKDEFLTLTTELFTFTGLVANRKSADYIVYESSDFAEKLKILFGGKSKKMRRVPSFILGANLEEKTAFLHGLTKYGVKNRVYSERMINELEYLFLSIGYVVNFKKYTFYKSKNAVPFNLVDFTLINKTAIPNIIGLVATNDFYVTTMKDINEIESKGVFIPENLAYVGISDVQEITCDVIEFEMNDLDSPMFIMGGAVLVGDNDEN